MSFWQENAIEPHKHALVDCGYLNDKTARDRADKILAHVSRTNIEVAGFNRLLVRLPPTKLTKVLAAIPQIKKGAATYCWCTHGWVDDVPSNARGEAPPEAVASSAE